MVRGADVSLTIAEGQVLEWIREGRWPARNQYVVEGAPQRMAAHFTTYVCLYPGRPRVRGFTLKLPANAPMPRDEHERALMERSVRDMLKTATLPSDAEAKHRILYAGSKPRPLWKAGVDLSWNAGLPLGVYMAGRTAVTGRFRAILVVNAVLSPERFLRELRRAVGR